MEYMNFVNYVIDKLHHLSETSFSGQRMLVQHFFTVTQETLRELATITVEYN
jgi:hypothetical protein